MGAASSLLAACDRNHLDYSATAAYLSDGTAAATWCELGRKVSPIPGALASHQNTTSQQLCYQRDKQL